MGGGGGGGGTGNRVNFIVSQPKSSYFPPPPPRDLYRLVSWFQSNDRRLPRMKLYMNIMDAFVLS